MSYDVLIAGLGAVGSAAAYHLARRGVRVLGLDRFAPPHAEGSSHGGSRIIRKIYFEGAHYVPLLERAYALWHDLEAEAGETLLHATGGLNTGLPESDLVAGARQSCEAHGLPYDMLTADETRARFPAFQLPEDHVALWDPEAGWLSPEACIRVHLDQARRHGAVLHTDEPVTAWRADGDGVAVTTARGTYRAGHLVLCTGGWIGDLVPALAPVLRVERAVNGWFRPRTHADRFAPEHCPVYIGEYRPGRIVYGFPDTGDGVKAGLHHEGTRVAHPDALDRTVTDADVNDLRAALRRLLPGADGTLLRTATCFYTNTPDEHYFVDRHPDRPQVLLASACSGHGFKSSNAVGEALADWATDRPPQVALDAFRRRW